MKGIKSKFDILTSMKLNVNGKLKYL